MSPLVFLILLAGAVALGYRLGRRRPPTAEPYYEAPARSAGKVVPLRPVGTQADDRREVAEAARELGRWLESAVDAREEISPTTWDRIAEASSRIAEAAGRLSARDGKE